MSFKIFFKEPTVLTVNGKQITFNSNKVYGFRNIDKKEAEKIRKLALKGSSMIYTMTDDFLGCYATIEGRKAAKDKVVNNLVNMNKSKKNKGNTGYKQFKKNTESEEQPMEAGISLDEVVGVDEEVLNNE